MVEVRTKIPEELAAGASPDSDGKTAVFDFERSELLSAIEEIRIFLGEYRLISERVTDSNEWNLEALQMLQRHRSLFGEGASPGAKVSVLFGLFRFMALRLRQDRFEFRIPTKVGLIPEKGNHSLEAFSSEFRVINEMLDGLVSDVTALSAGEMSRADDRLRRVLLAMASFLKSLVRQDWDDLALFMTHINLITTSAESHEIVGRIAQIAREIYNSLNEFSRFLNVESLTQTTEDLPDAVVSLKSVITRLEDAANTNLDSLELLGTQARETRAWLADSMETVAGCQTEIDQLKAAHPEMAEGLAELEGILNSEIGSALGHLDDKTAGYEQTYMTMIGNQSFQDLTGQTLKKVIKFIETMQFKLVELLPKNALIKPAAEAREGEPSGEQRDASKPIQSQDQVDQMLADLGF